MSSPAEFQELMEAASDHLFDEIRDRFNLYMEDFMLGTMVDKVDGDPLTTRTGALRQSFGYTETGADASTWAAIGFTTSKNAPTHEFGATIVPKKAKKLAIPLPAALTPSGVTRGSPRSFQDTFIQRSKAGNLILFQKQPGGGLSPLFVLKDSVKIPASLGMFDSFDADKPERSRLLKEAVAETLIQYGGGKRG